MTEAEALKMICPVMPPHQDAPALCCATGCMAWRWIDDEYQYYATDRTRDPDLGGDWEEWPAQPGELPSWNDAMTRWRLLTVPRRGYCGLAVKP